MYVSVSLQFCLPAPVLLLLWLLRVQVYPIFLLCPLMLFFQAQQQQQVRCSAIDLCCCFVRSERFVCLSAVGIGCCFCFLLFFYEGCQAVLFLLVFLILLFLLVF